MQVAGVCRRVVYYQFMPLLPCTRLPCPIAMFQRPISAHQSSCSCRISHSRHVYLLYGHGIHLSMVTEVWGSYIRDGGLITGEYHVWISKAMVSRSTNPFATSYLRISLRKLVVDSGQAHHLSKQWSALVSFSPIFVNISAGKPDILFYCHGIEQCVSLKQPAHLHPKF